MSTRNSETNDEAQIRTLIEERVKAVRAKDVDGAASHIAPDIVGSLRSLEQSASRFTTWRWRPATRRRSVTASTV
jgi:hypothetical protein